MIEIFDYHQFPYTLYCHKDLKQYGKLIGNYGNLWYSRIIAKIIIKNFW